jgi:uncharacterized membrane protein YraQ (UPF0718 family)
MLRTSIQKKRFVGIILLMLIILPFLIGNRFAKLDIVAEDVISINQPQVECFQGFCIEKDPSEPFLSRWWGFSIEYLKLVTIGMAFAFSFGGLTEGFIFPRGAGINLWSGGTFKRVLKGLAISPILNVCAACVVPPAVGAARRGAGIPATIAIVQGSATMNFLAMIMVFIIFSPLLAFSRVIITILAAFLLGPLVSKFSKEEDISILDEFSEIEITLEDQESSWSSILSEGFTDSIKVIYSYILKLAPIMIIAGFFSGIFAQLISPDTISEYLGNDLRGIAIAATLGVLINVPLLFEIPLVALLIMMGAGAAPAAVLLWTAAAGGPITFWGLATVMSRRAISIFATGTWLFGFTGGIAVWILITLIPGIYTGINPDKATAAPALTTESMGDDIHFGNPDMIVRGHTVEQLMPSMTRTAALWDGIPALNNPSMIKTSEVHELFRDDEEIIGIEINGDARAYPKDILSRHEIVNDEIGGVPVAITWCPLIYMGIAFEREIGEEVLDFAVTGYLVLNNLIMFDRSTESWWVQLTGDSIKGDRSGSKLKKIPAIQTTWGLWKEMYPDTLILDENLGFQFDPYENYYSSGWTAGGRNNIDDRMYKKDYVLGVIVGDATKAYPFTVMGDNPIVNDSLGSEKIVVTFDKTTKTSGGAFNRKIEGDMLTFVYNQNGNSSIIAMSDVETGSKWNIFTGESTSGPMKGKRLQAMEYNVSFWFAWADWHPSSAIFLE